MSTSVFPFSSSIKPLLLALILTPLPVLHADDWTLGRTIDGQPDLQGVWANNSITPEERPEFFGTRETMTEKEMQFLARRVEEIQSDGDALFGDSLLNAAFSGNESSRDTETGNYDQQWMADRTLHNRTSQVIDPPNGRYPQKTAQALQHAAELRAYAEQHPADSWLDRSLSERCVHRGVPNLRAGYNSFWQIIQSRDHVAIVQEMFHDVRPIPLVAKPPLNENIRLWNGSSRGYWDGDILVIDTKNFNEKSDPGLDTVARVYQERFTRISADQLQYDIHVIDPGTYVANYIRRIIFDSSRGEIYEYACHEGNYGMRNILSGHREEERRALEVSQSND
jgi:hypothetical protein